MREKNTFRWFCVSLIICLAVLAHYLFDPWGFYWKVSPDEAALRMELVTTAQEYLGYQERDGSHTEILDIYNSHEPLAMGYAVQTTDSWCAAFVSAMGIRCNMTEIIPTECSCERQIGLFQSIGRWIESDDYLPLPGDLIYYDWNMKKLGDSTGWSDHVGIVVGTKWPFMKVIEGNKDDSVSYRIIPLSHIHIRGFAVPDYHSLTK